MLKPIRKSFQRRQGDLPPWLWLAVPVVLAWVYWPARQIGYLADDYQFIHYLSSSEGGALTFRLGAVWDQLWFRPWVIWSYKAQLLLAGSEPGHFHMVNLIIHGMNVLLLGRLATLVIGSRTAGIVSALLFSVMPIHGETVLWVSGRFDGLSTLGQLIALCGWLEYGKSRSKAAASAVFFGTLLALGSKETAILLPLWFGLFAWIRGWSLRKWVGPLWLGMVLLCAGWFVLRSYMLQGGGVLPTESGYSFHVSPERVPRRAAQFWAACLVPTTERSLSAYLSPWVLLYIGSFGALVVLARRGLRRRDWRPFFGFLVAALPIAALARLQPDWRESRYIYLLSGFGCLAITALLQAPMRLPGSVSKLSLPGWLLIAVTITGWQTSKITANWLEAGQIARDVVATFPACEENDPVFVTGLPEAHKGAFVFLNAFHLALIHDRNCSANVRVGPPQNPGALHFHWNGSWKSK